MSIRLATIAEKREISESFSERDTSSRYSDSSSVFHTSQTSLSSLNANNNNNNNNAATTTLNLSSTSGSSVNGNERGGYLRTSGSGDSSDSSNGGVGGCNGGAGEEGLQFASLGLYGRKVEQEELETCVYRLVQENEKQFIILSGKSGTGKTSLVEATLRPLVKKKMKGLYAEGKFDQYLSRSISNNMNDKNNNSSSSNNNNNHSHYYQINSGPGGDEKQPLTGWHAVCQDLCRQVQTLRMRKSSATKMNLKEIRRKVIKELGSINMNGNIHNDMTTTTTTTMTTTTAHKTELLELIKVFPVFETILVPSQDEEEEEEEEAGRRRRRRTATNKNRNQSYDDTGGNNSSSDGSLSPTRKRTRNHKKNQQHQQQHQQQRNNQIPVSGSSSISSGVSSTSTNVSSETATVPTSTTKPGSQQQETMTVSDDNDLLGKQVQIEKRNMLIHAFRIIIRILSNALSPMVIVLDNLHVADTLSLELLKSLLSDYDNKNLVVVGIYRSDQVIVNTTTAVVPSNQLQQNNSNNNNIHPLMKTIHDIKLNHEELNVSITEMNIGNLDVKFVHELLRDLLCTNDPKLLDLAQLCYIKTNGNVFHVIHFVTILYESNMLEYDGHGSDNNIIMIGLGSSSNDNDENDDFNGDYYNHPHDDDTTKSSCDDWQKQQGLETAETESTNQKRRYKKWLWDLVEIEQRTANVFGGNTGTSYTNNNNGHQNNNNNNNNNNDNNTVLLKVLQQEMNYKLSLDEQKLLMFGAMLGSTFSFYSIYILWQTYHQRKQIDIGTIDDNDVYLLTDLLQDALDTCESIGFLECITTTTTNAIDDGHGSGNVVGNGGGDGGGPGGDGNHRDGVNKNDDNNASTDHHHRQQQNIHYRWVHDKMQEAALSMIPAEHKVLFYQEIGEVLIKTLNDNELDANIFVVVNCFNQGTAPISLARRSLLAELNLHAAMKCMSYNAYENAANYCEWGIKVLNNRWSTSYDLCLKLYSLAAELELYLKHYSKMEVYCRLILMHEDKPFHDKFHAYNILMDSMSMRNQHDEAAKLCLKVLKNYGTTFPSKGAATTFRTVLETIKVRKGVHARTEEEVDKLSVMSNNNQNEYRYRIEQLSLLDKLIRYSLVADGRLLSLVAFKSLQLTHQYGISSFSIIGSAIIGFVLIAYVNDIQAGCVYGKYALLLFNKLSSSATTTTNGHGTGTGTGSNDTTKRIESRTKFIIHAYILHWIKPIQTMMKPLLRAYEIGMFTGDYESAMFSIYHYIIIAFISGQSLSSLEKYCMIYTKQMKDIQCEIILFDCIVTKQMIINLLGQSSSSSSSSYDKNNDNNKNAGYELTLNDPMTKENNETTTTTAASSSSSSSSKKGPSIELLQIHQLLLYSFFGKHNEAAKHILEKTHNGGSGGGGGNSSSSTDTNHRQQQQRSLQAHPFIILDTFHRGLSFLAAINSNSKEDHKKGNDNNKIKKDGTTPSSPSSVSTSPPSSSSSLSPSSSTHSRYMKEGKRALSRITNWLQQGNPNVKHMEALLEAELAAAQGSIYTAKEHYESAVSAAARGGFVQYHALANERYANFLLSSAVQNDELLSGAGNGFSKETNENRMKKKKQRAIRRLNMAIELYREWGANAKVEDLCQKYAELLLSSASMSMSIDDSERRRYDEQYGDDDDDAEYYDDDEYDYDDTENDDSEGVEEAAPTSYLDQ